MKVYISGPMTGLPDYNFPAFLAAKMKIGHTAVSPIDGHEGAEDTSWSGYMRRDLAMLLQCQAIVMLPGWHNSKGARLERYVASELGMTIFETVDEAVEAIKRRNHDSIFQGVG